MFLWLAKRTKFLILFSSFSLFRPFYLIRIRPDTSKTSHDTRKKPETSASSSSVTGGENWQHKIRSRNAKTDVEHAIGGKLSAPNYRPQLIKITIVIRPNDARSSISALITFPTHYYFSGHPASPSANNSRTHHYAENAAAAVEGVVHENYTRGIEVHQASSIGNNVGDLSVWEFSGEKNYRFLYDHFIGNVNCIHLVLVSLQDGLDEQKRQLRSWLNFLRARIPPVEPLGDGGRSKRPGRVLICATHADAARIPTTKNAVGETQSRDADILLKTALDEFGCIFELHPLVFVLDANVSSSLDLKALKQTVAEIKTEIVEVNK